MRELRELMRTELINRAVLGLFVTASISFLLSPASAEEEGGWTKYCDDSETCIIRRVIEDDSGRLLGSLLLRYGLAENPLMVVALQPPVDLRAGMAWDFGGGTVEQVPYMICDEKSCSAQAVAGKNHVDLLRSSPSFVTTGTALDGSSVKLTVDLNGFDHLYQQDPALSPSLDAVPSE